jgi:hypothetical protein
MIGDTIVSQLNECPQSARYLARVKTASLVSPEGHIETCTIMLPDAPASLFFSVASRQLMSDRQNQYEVLSGSSVIAARTSCVRVKAVAPNGCWPVTRT